MSLILCYVYSKSEIANDWKQTPRKTGMNQLIWMKHQYPANKDIILMKKVLKQDQVAILFDPLDKAVEIYHPVGD